jgi:preprotein translocase subunit SecE
VRSGGAAATTAGPARGAAREIDPPKPKISPVEFGAQVRAEGRKITWPSRKETWITSVFVGVFVLLAAIFFALVDGVLSFLLQMALDLVNR